MIDADIINSLLAHKREIGLRIKSNSAKRKAAPRRDAFSSRSLTFIWARYTSPAK
jgi:hypothetical protein